MWLPARSGVLTCRRDYWRAQGSTHPAIAEQTAGRGENSPAAFRSGPRRPTVRWRRCCWPVLSEKRRPAKESESAPPSGTRRERRRWPFRATHHGRSPFTGPEITAATRAAATKGRAHRMTRGDISGRRRRQEAMAVLQNGRWREATAVDGPGAWRWPSCGRRFRPPCGQTRQALGPVSRGPHTWALVPRDATRVTPASSAAAAVVGPRRGWASSSPSSS